MTDAFTAAYMEACKDRPADHNEIGLWYFRKGWEIASRHGRETNLKLRDTLMVLRNHTSVTLNQIEMIDEALRAQSTSTEVPAQR